MHTFYVFDERFILGSNPDHHLAEVKLSEIDPINRGKAAKDILDDLTTVIRKPEWFDTDAGPQNESLKKELMEFIDNEFFADERKIDGSV
jgi:hypothetical protein